MKTLTPTGITIKLTRLEKELQLLRRQTQSVFPKKNKSSAYSEKTLTDAVQETRNMIWQERYAKNAPKVARVR